MGWWQVNADTLARSRFVVSPLAETFACLKLLHAGVAAHPGERAWLDAHLPAHRRRLAGDPVTALLVRAGLGRGWIADFLTPAPREGEGFEEGVARVRATRPDQARADLAVSLGGPLPADLDRDDLPARAAALLEDVWTEAVRPDWDRRRRVLEADVVARTARVSRGGWAAVLDALRPGTRWLGDGRLQINANPYPPRELSGAELVLVPVTAQRRGWVSWEEPERYAVVYPCTGVLADDGVRRVPAALGALLGPARAGVLTLLGSPMSTSQLVGVTGQGLGSVGRHLRVLLEAGLVERRRAGRSVLYSRTAAGEVLIEASGPGAAEVREEGGARGDGGPWEGGARGDGGAREGDAREGDAREGDAREGDAREGDAREGDAREAGAREAGARGDGGP
nr:winged helix-turn-helix domain-containing protein [Streptomyces sp. TOR3209]